ncbi:MAG: type II toxin-antitoxin system PrlF family antitoxin [Gammaproteobacteria bacterium]|nr:type II toxin-antitoxin system PrlF family antitoxin [Gammaproteobacteria bacterium]
MIESTVTARGQTTIPKLIRIKLSLEAGVRIRYELDADGVRLVPLKPVRRLGGILNYSGEPKTLEDMERGIVEGATDD